MSSYDEQPTIQTKVLKLNPWLIWPILMVVAIILRMLFLKEWTFSFSLMLAAILWLYMAMNIWANDVANNMWPAVWSKAVTLAWAIAIAAVFEATWALIAWWDVVNTIKWWIIDVDISTLTNTTQFISVMMATLLWSALWINIATYVKAPVSATHSIIWWLVWAWLFAYWFDTIAWAKILQVSAWWVISPIMWWIVATSLLIIIDKLILNRSNRSDAAKTWVPVLLWVMIWVFLFYLVVKWLKQVFSMEASLAFSVSGLIALLWYIFIKELVSKHGGLFKNSKKAINKLFNIPLIFSAALLSFAHWANDVANAIWPLAAINDVIQNWWISINAWIPIWVMIIWAIWISSWLAIFGAKLIKTVWWEITKLNQIRAYCVALWAAATVIIASWLWLPVSSTHIAIWWIFWIWLRRQRIKRLEWKHKEYIRKNIIWRIVLAWVITLPVSWLISWTIYLILNKSL